MQTFVATPTAVERRWHVIDADGAVLGRVATEAARLLQGKHRAIYTPFLDTGDHVVILNAEPTAMDDLADAVLRGSIGQVLPHLVGTD